MPRDNDKNNDSRGARDRPGGGKSRSGAARGPEKKFAKRGFGRRDDGDQRGGERQPYAGKSEGTKSVGKKPYAGKREGGSFRRDDDRPARRPRKDFRARDDRDGDKRSFKPRGERPTYGRDDRPARQGRTRDSGGREEGRAAGRFQDRKFGDKRPYTPRGEGFRKGGDRPRGDRTSGDRPLRDGEKRFSRGPRNDFGDRPERGEDKPWQKRNDRGGDERPRFSRAREDRPKFDRPREHPDHDRGRPAGRTEWQEHPRSEGRFRDRPRRDNEDDSKIFAKRPAFGGRGAYRERTPDADKRAPRPEPKPKKAGERIAKVVARAGLASRRDAEELITQGRVTVNGRVINSPALDVTANDVIAVDGKVLPPRERTRLFMYYKPRGLMTTHADPEGRPTVFDNLPEGLPRLISVGRLDFNTEGLLLLTNDGGLARALELPDTGWLRRYRVRAHGEVTQAQLDELKKGVEVDGVKYGPIDATLERDQGANVWLVFAIREGKNREVRNVMAHLGLEVNRLIRVSYGPFQLGELEEGQVEEVKTRVLREQLGEKIAALAGADFNRPLPEEKSETEDDAPRGKKPFKPAGKSALIADRKGRRVLVQRTGSDEARARNEDEASGYGPPRRPKRGYHGKRDLKPRDE
ncbi:pseudouridine synthase [Bradyrhizobium archetypum]|uniref:Pseudouridine synthase n=1 Tax=Bradyrhizobium archetypum TaxID=2721160 RepID=A0A7Y4H4D2_9BRAD|nr:pseudouridine synthase [Bradyrhizobium archetypum]NOJ47153.1 pseudouridine synthase [Bradyrhizobium archetypum]